MLDIKFIRENPDLIKEAARKKHIVFDIDKLLAADKERVAVMTEVENARAKQNSVSMEIVKAADQAHRNVLIAEMKVLKDSMQKGEEKLAVVMKEWKDLMLAVPNVPDVSVPEGLTDAENLEVKVWGEKPSFDFPVKSHVELMGGLNLLDLERGIKVAGFRGNFLSGAAAMLSFAIWQYALSLLAKKGFVPMIVPSLVKPEPFYGTGYLPLGAEDLYKTQDDTFLSGTAEVPTMGFYMDEIVPKEKLPIKFVSFSPCYRREAGSHGKDTRGLIRLHEFYKVEQVVLCEASHVESVRLHEELLANAEEIMQGLKIPYHVVANCGGDIGQGQVKKYDIEAWVPSEGKYRETHSISYFHDFQNRRLNIRYKDTDGKNHFAHSLNGTAAATPRLLVPLIENNQNADGSINVPEVLRPFVGIDVIR